ncbi:MAG: YceI family protein [Bacteroidales bacterium]|jgi:polyisoprenoid-binding protein YceI|nr:YceI family protein [Bacteroidales bacterium]
MKKLNVLFGLLLMSIFAFAQEVPVNIEQSELKWTGKKVTGEHWGYIQLQEASLMVKNDQIKSGVFKIDMRSMDCQDLENEKTNAQLIGHLKSDDFFSVDQYPVSTLKIKEATPFQQGFAEIKGDLTIKGITQPISFKAEQLVNGYKATITVDRTKYNVRYGSGKFFDNLGDNMIYDDFTLEVKIITK